MDINIEWQEPIQLTNKYDIIIDENKLPESVRDVPGVYFFSRKFGERYEPFYIGETLVLQRRLGQHLKTKQLAFVLKRMNEKIKKGERYFHFGYFMGKPGQDAKKCIRIVQQYLVREAVAQQVTLLNVRLIAFKPNTITFSGSAKARAIYSKKAIVEP